ncbi:hypothetical protein [Allochromatium tepidum]|uniref:PhoU domain-containing protein n=1 Tax=Allochromatium tepidum TaxID=553982 RepID=A0ABN6GGS3_9GAMM|nr:hypothetical protein [Allochromatium tepidum]BCU07126.1 hypothetical protein Atep_18030 [Allochromatium tepidum]
MTPLRDYAPFLDFMRTLHNPLLAILIAAIFTGLIQSSAATTGIATAEVPRQIANAHTLFNVANTLLFIGLTGPMARLVEWLVPDEPPGEEAFIVRPRYLDEELLNTPSLALDRARLEILHMGDSVREMMRLIMSISEPTREVLLNFHRAVSRALGAALQAVAQNNEIAARTVTAMKGEISEIADSAAAREARRLVAEEPKRIRAYTLEIDIIEKLQRIYYFAKRMAKTVETDTLAENA